MPFITLAIVFIAEFLTTPKALLFYDQIEYLTIVSTHNFWQVLTLGHFPIHPVFLAIFWITSRLVLPNTTALIFGVISAALMYLISKIIFRNGRPWLATLIFLLFPGVWLVNTNLMVHSVLLTFYLAAIYFLLKKKAVLFFLAVLLMAGVHFDAAYWIPTIFVFPIVFKKEINLKNKDIFKFAILGAAALLISVASYAAIYIFIRKDYVDTTEQLLAYSSFGTLRMIRNIWYGFFNSFGTLIPFLLAFLIAKNTKEKSEWVAWAVFAIAIAIGGAYWEGDLMQRRIVFAGVLIALFLYKYLKNKSFWVILYLIPIIVANGILYYRDSTNMVLAVMQKHIDELPKGQVLLQSHYYQPFTKYDGKILWIGTDSLDQIDGFLKNGTRVFITQESVTAPYRLVVGNNYHITSMDKVGDSESKFLFSKYEFDKFGDNLELKLNTTGKISAQAGEPVIKYDSGFWSRLSRNRIDYGDVGSWIWAIITNHRDPTGWTYDDIHGTHIDMSFIR
ncbi:MAG: hypothetical protein NTZ07_03380 [Candidatus Woesebacteria bacterium]|nr:hypothetical protein [Candidatus Woesebacteria bacterium]